MKTSKHNFDILKQINNQKITDAGGQEVGNRENENLLSKVFFGEIKVIVDVDELRWACPKQCGGYMVATGDYFAIYPIAYLHQCDKCNYNIALHVKFPIDFFDA